MNWHLFLDACQPVSASMLLRLVSSPRDVSYISRTLNSDKLYIKLPCVHTNCVVTTATTITNIRVALLSSARQSTVPLICHLACRSVLLSNLPFPW